MSDPLTTSIITAVVSGLVGGTGVALLSNFLNKRKTNAEIQKLQADAEKSRAESEKIKAEIATVTYTISASPEEILIDGRSTIDGFDVKGSGGKFWGNNSQPITPEGQGYLKFEDGGVLNVQRTNTDGRFELLFQRYIYKSGEHPLIPKDDLISGKRKLRVSCEAKSAGADHTLRFMIRDPVTKQRLAEDRVKVTTNQWTSLQVYLSADPNVDSQFRIDDEEVSKAPSSVQIRNIVLTQRK